MMLHFKTAYLQFSGQTARSYLQQELVQYVTRSTHFGKFLFQLAPSDNAWTNMANFIHNQATLDPTTLDQIKTFNALAGQREELAP
jgi:hypothetical protein